MQFNLLTTTVIRMMIDDSFEMKIGIEILFEMMMMSIYENDQLYLQVEKM